MDVLIMSENSPANKKDGVLIKKIFGKDKVVYDKQFNTGWVATVNDEFEGRMRCLSLRSNLSKQYVGILYESFWEKTPAIEHIIIY